MQAAVQNYTCSEKYKIKTTKACFQTSPGFALELSYQPYQLLFSQISALNMCLIQCQILIVNYFRKPKASALRNR